MAVRQVVQFIIYPKIFHSIDFYRRGIYHLTFSIYNQLQNDIKQFSCPFLIQSKNANQNQLKKAKLDMQKFIYNTQQFQVKYSSQTYFLNTMAIFTLQYQLNQKYKTVLQIGLNKIDQEDNNKVKANQDNRKFNFSRSSNLKKEKTLSTWEDQSNKKNKNFKFQQIKNDLQKQTTINKNYKRVQTKKVYLNKHLNIQSFKKICFTQPMYFSYLQFHISSFHQGYLIRRKPYQRSDFWLFQFEKKQKVYHEEKLYVKNQQKLGKRIRKIFKVDNINQFYKYSVQKALKQYERVVQFTNILYQKVNLDKTKSKIQAQSFINLKYVLIPQKQRQTHLLMKKYQTNLQDQLYFYILNESYDIVKNIKYVLHFLSSLLLQISNDIFKKLVKQEKQKQNTFRINKLVKKQLFSSEKRKHIKKNFVVKRQNFLKNCTLVEDIDLHHPLIILQNYDWDQYQVRLLPKITDTLVVLVHGYHGSPTDMQKLKNYLQIVNQKCHFLLVKSISLDMNGTIFQIAKNVAKQVRSYLENSLVNYKKINFVGFSLGGVICRAVIHLLQQYHKNLNILVTLGSPHLGVSHIQNNLVSLGVWYMRKFQNAKNLDDLTTIQSVNQQQNTLSLLSKSQSLKCLKKIVVVSCKQDHFVPQYSSKIQEYHNNKFVLQLSQNIRQRVRRLQRINVWFDISHDTGPIDDLIGRRSHVQFLDNDRFLQILVHLYGHQF